MCSRFGPAADLAVAALQASTRSMCWRLALCECLHGLLPALPACPPACRCPNRASQLCACVRPALSSWVGGLTWCRHARRFPLSWPPTCPPIRPFDPQGPRPWSGHRAGPQGKGCSDGPGWLGSRATRAGRRDGAACAWRAWGTCSPLYECRALTSSAFVHHHCCRALVSPWNERDSAHKRFLGRGQWQHGVQRVAAG